MCRCPGHLNSWGSLPRRHVAVLERAAVLQYSDLTSCIWHIGLELQGEISCTLTRLNISVTCYCQILYSSDIFVCAVPKVPLLSSSKAQVDQPCLLAQQAMLRTTRHATEVLQPSWRGLHERFPATILAIFQIRSWRTMMWMRRSRMSAGCQRCNRRKGASHKEMQPMQGRGQGWEC